MQFTLAMEGLIVNDQKIDELIIQWIEEDVSESYVFECSNEWISNDHFLTEKMQGLRKVGESSLTIGPTDQ